MMTNRSRPDSKDNRSSFDKALKFLSYRIRSEKEVRDYLEKNNFSDSEISEAIEKLLDYKFLDDEKFSELFIKDRQLKGKGKRAIAFELKRKGISSEIIEKNLQESHDDYRIAKEYIFKRLHLFKNLSPEKRKQRIIGRLQSRGYNWDVVNKILKEVETTS